MFFHFHPKFRGIPSPMLGLRGARTLSYYFYYSGNYFPSNTTYNGHDTIALQRDGQTDRRTGMQTVAMLRFALHASRRK